MQEFNKFLPLGFFQFEMQGGIFHSFCSFTVTLRVGLWSTGAGGDGGPLGIFLLILNLGGSMGSTCKMTMANTVYTVQF